MIVIKFEDFRKLALDNNKRVYYYQTDSLLELYFLLEGIFVKSFVDTSKIQNKEVFFADRLFIGATQLLFNVPDKVESRIGTRDAIEPARSIVEVNAPVEAGGGEDIQKDAVLEVEE